MKMLVTEWDFERKLAVVGEEHYQTGWAEGQRDFIRNMYKGGFTVAEIVRAAGFSEQEVKDILGQS